ncbi:zinc finger CCCH domain-containing protein 16 isoform X2 [Andrographis paniculata]|nr:zinc finger CCCH domain-containing protein 16 isoform X2 [Andrographis paniculata]XP_051114196.1 zinc finger CCCH domain-containing protein 16 isoform X2 [Andrographis paniculata]XP_051114198.1 zinc finger CCCH domain-containing protein 16 isoform X2 [Andrographis paniculata]
MPNPFGFGVQNNAQSRGGNEFGSKPNQFKPFENKWTRNTGSGFASRPSDKQPQAADHKCTDPDSCKRIIVEDLENEKPLWKLTCYGHDRYAPCDVVGDISCEELRALAYEDAKNGKSLQFIIERERNLLASKLAEFQNLLQKPYVIPTMAAPAAQNPFSVANSSTPTINSGVPSSVSSFSHVNASLNTSPAAAPSYTFGQPTAPQSNNSNNQPFNMFQAMNSSINNPGKFGNQPPQQPVQNPFSFGSARANNSATSNPFSNFANSSQTEKMFDKPFDLSITGTNSALNPAGNSSISAVSLNTQNENPNIDAGIWAKAEWKWNAGEIPEDPPPDIYIR